MTREEKIEILENEKAYMLSHGGDSQAIALDAAIKALQQEPCEDCISREAAIRIAEQGQIHGYEWQFKKLTRLPSVTPKPKIGHWVYDEAHSDWFDITYECSCCKRSITVPYTSYEALNEVYKDYPYCHCGARMIDPQEGEIDK